MKTTQLGMVKLFHDPILTFVPLVLLNMLWVLLPASIPALPEPGGADAVREAMARLSAEYESLENRWRWLLDQEVENSADAQRCTDAQRQFNELMQQKEGLEAELARIEQQLEELRKAVPDPSQVEMQRRLKQLEEDAKTKANEIEALEEKIARKQAEAKRALSEQETERAKLQLALDQETAKVAALQGARNPGDPKGNGLPLSVVQRTDKVVSYVELDGNKLYVLARKQNLNEESYEFISTSAAKRKSSARGERIEEFTRPTSQYQKELKQLNPKQDAIILVVHPDSIPAFTEARKVACGLGFEIGWRPCTFDVFHAGSGGSKERTFPNQNR